MTRDDSSLQGDIQSDQLARRPVHVGPGPIGKSEGAFILRINVEEARQRACPTGTGAPVLMKDAAIARIRGRRGIEKGSVGVAPQRSYGEDSMRHEPK